MTRGPDPIVPTDAYLDAVERLYAEQAQDRAGVYPEEVALELDVSTPTARKHLDRLVERGDLDRSRYLNTGRGTSRKVYRPPEAE